MKQYSVIDKQTGHTIAGPFDDSLVAHRVKKALGGDFDVCTWIGHFGLPAMACVFRLVDDREQLETICTYKAQAVAIGKQMEREYPGRVNVRTVVINTQYPQGEDYVGTSWKDINTGEET